MAAEKLLIKESQVADTIFQFHLAYAQWSYLRRERLRGRPIPQSAEELENGLRHRPTREYVEVMQVYRRLKTEHEEGRPGVKLPPSDLHWPTRKKPLKIRPFYSSSRKKVEHRKRPPDPRKRVWVRPSYMITPGNVLLKRAEQGR